MTYYKPPRPNKLYKKLQEQYFILFQKDMPEGIVPWDIVSNGATMTPRNVRLILQVYFPDNGDLVASLKRYNSTKMKTRKVKHDPNAIPNYYWPWMPKNLPPEIEALRPKPPEPPPIIYFTLDI